MNDLDNFFINKIYVWGIKNFYSFRGLIALEFFLVILLLSLYEVLLKNIISFHLCLILIVLSVITLIITWLFYRHTPVFKKNEVGIIIALTGEDKDSDTELTRLSKKLKALINQEKLESEVKIKSIPKNLIPKKEKDAYKLIKNSGATLIIWGSVDSGNANSEKVTVFSPIHLSYILALPPKDIIKIGQNIVSMLSKKRWVITEKDNIFNRSYVAENLEGISLYIIGLSLYFFGNREKSKEILSRALFKYNCKDTHDLIAIQNISWILKHIFDEKIKNLELWPLGHNQSRDIKQAKEIISEMKYLGLSNDTLLIDAQVKFVNKDINEARNLLLKSHSLFPNDPVPLLNLAFLDFWEGKYDNGKKYLVEGLKKNPLLLGDQLNSIIIWYEMALQEDPSNLHLHYPLGRFYYLQGNYSLAEDSFKEILEIYKNTKNQMHYEAEQYIRKISKK